MKIVQSHVLKASGLFYHSILHYILKELLP